MWYSPPFDRDANYELNALVQRDYNSLEDFSEATGQESNSILIDLDIFRNVTMPDPNGELTDMYSIEEVDYRLRRGATAIDAGMVLPGVNDGFSGRAPDLGAVEFGEDMPHFGPRTP